MNQSMLTFAQHKATAVRANPAPRGRSVVVTQSAHPAEGTESIVLRRHPRGGQRMDAAHEHGVLAGGFSLQQVVVDCTRLGLQLGEVLQPAVDPQVLGRAIRR
jgi:hypothetical protein